MFGSGQMDLPGHRLAQLAPTIAEGILDGRQGEDVMLR